jgi:hypothetical protein
MLTITVQLRDGRFHISARLRDASLCINDPFHKPVDGHLVDSFLRALAAAPAELLALRRRFGHGYRTSLEESLRQFRFALDSGRLSLTRCRMPGQQRSVGAGPEADAGEQAGRSAPVRAIKTWIEIELIDENENPVPGALYKIELPDGRLVKGRLDSFGLTRYSNIDPGNCLVSFPEIYEWTAV